MSHGNLIVRRLLEPRPTPKIREPWRTATRISDLYYYLFVCDDLTDEQRLLVLNRYRDRMGI